MIQAVGVVRCRVSVVLFKACSRARARARAATVLLLICIAPSPAAATAATTTARATTTVAARTASAVAAAAPSRATKAAIGHSLLSSRELWATVDVCNPKDQPDTVGIRGSMPGDPQERGTAMYMRFALQYKEAKSGAWADLSHGDESGFIEVGTGKVARQGGTSFQLAPAATSGPGYTLRGLVTFQWRHEGLVIHEATRTTSASHQSLAGSDPPGYSAAECTIP